MNDVKYKMSDADFAFYQKILLERSGLSLSPDKIYLLCTRLGPVAQSLGYPTLDHMTSALKLRPDQVVIKSIVEAMTTNETSFFRDTKPFQYLKDSVLPSLVEKKGNNKTLRVWSAACSSGQEAYSIAMTLEEFFQNKPGWTYQIVGTDISEDILKQARAAAYSQFEIQRGLTIQMMVKYFEQKDDQWHVKDKIKSAARFQSQNLLENMASLGTFDIIFCRNVLIYFNKETKEKVLCKISERLSSHGALFLGSCESLLGLTTPLESLPSSGNVYGHKARTENVELRSLHATA